MFVITFSFFLLIKAKKKNLKCNFLFKWYCFQSKKRGNHVKYLSVHYANVSTYQYDHKTDILGEVLMAPKTKPENIVATLHSTLMTTESFIA